MTFSIPLIDGRFVEECFKEKKLLDISKFLIVDNNGAKNSQSKLHPVSEFLFCNFFSTTTTKKKKLLSLLFYYFYACFFRKYKNSLNYYLIKVRNNKN